jgi:hypothetical protein
LLGLQYALELELELELEFDLDLEFELISRAVLLNLMFVATTDK